MRSECPHYSRRSLIFDHCHRLVVSNISLQSLLLLLALLPMPSTAPVEYQTGRWEPIDGYAVDMSGFRNEGGDSNSDPGSSRRTSVSSGCGGISGDGNGSRGSASGGGTNSMASPCVPKGQT